MFEIQITTKYDDIIKITELPIHGELQQVWIKINGDVYPLYHKDLLDKLANLKQ